MAAWEADLIMLPVNKVNSIKSNQVQMQTDRKTDREDKRTKIEQKQGQVRLSDMVFAITTMHYFPIEHLLSLVVYQF